MRRIALPRCVPLLSGLSVCKKIGLGYVPATSFMLAVAAIAVLVLRTDAFDGSLADALQALLIVGLVVTAIASVSAMLTAFSVGERVRALLTAAEAAATGDLDRYVAFRPGGDEVDRLTGSFNTMTAELRALVESERLARSQAEAASEAKSQFLSKMSHELRTPLTIMLGFSGILQESASGRLKPNEDAYIRKMHEAAQHLLSVANDALDLSQVEAGQTTIDPQEIDLRELLDRAFESVRPLADERNHTFTMTAPPGQIIVSADPIRLRQVLYNLLSNAIKFTLPGGTITLRADRSGNELLLAVGDTGVGIPEERQGRVFGEFERLHTGVLKAPGAGLGLALSKRLVELHGGDISFESTPGIGTTFFVRLPGVIQAPIPAVGSSRLEGGNVAALFEDTDRRQEPESGLRVLLVDDEWLNTDLFAEVLEADGHEVIVEHDALAGERRAMSEPFDLLLLDIRMPGMRGDDLCQLLRSRGIDIPIVAISANAMVAEVQQGLRAGFDAYLTKPIAPHDLRQAVLDAVESRRQVNVTAG